MPDTDLDAATLAAEFTADTMNPCVGQTLLSEGPRARVWHIRLRPGERLGFHRHVLDYFWTALNAGTARSHVNGGPASVAHYTAGETRHLSFAAGEFMVHDLQNIGGEDLCFVTVEHMHSANAPLPLPPHVVSQGIEAPATPA